MNIRHIQKLPPQDGNSLYTSQERKRSTERSTFKSRLAELAWKVISNAQILNYYLRFLNKSPVKFRFLLIKILRKSYIRFFRIFEKQQQYERAFYAIRIMRIAFRSLFSRPNSKEKLFYARTCLKVGALQRLCRESVSPSESPSYVFIVAQAHLLSGEYQKANELINLALLFESNNAELLRFGGIIQVLLGNYKKAEEMFKTRILLNKSLLVPHQNLAAKYHPKDFPLTISELMDAGNLQIYDQLNYMGEHFFHYGKLSESLEAYKCALLHQKKIKQNFTLPRHLISYLERFENFKKDLPIAILPTEWVTQIGHIALLDIFLKIEHYERKRDCNYILLAPKSLVANPHYLSYWKSHFCIVEDAEVVRQFIPHQRQLGEGFVPFLRDSGEIEPWTRTGARAQYLWQQEKKAPFLKLAQDDQNFAREVLQSMGLPSDAWFAALHIRESSFHKEKGGAGDHRNAHISDYIDAVTEITSRGGWVIRMGDSNMFPFPKMKNVIDYAHSEFKSARMDICLIAMAYLFIGTTSGLTTAALSFDQSALLVNVISNDWQLWTNKTHFLPKLIFDLRKKRMLTLADLYISKNRDLLFKKELMNRKKWEVVVNRREDILDAVKYKLDVIEHKVALNPKQEEMLHNYKAHMAEEPYMFGASQIVPNFLEKHPYLILSTSSSKS